MNPASKPFAIIVRIQPNGLYGRKSCASLKVYIMLGITVIHAATHGLHIAPVITITGRISVSGLPASPGIGIAASTIARAVSMPTRVIL